MADEYHVVLRVDEPVSMRTLTQIKADGWTKGDRYHDDKRVVDEQGKHAGKYISWHRGTNEDVWVSERGFPAGKTFHFDEFAEPSSPTC